MFSRKSEQIFRQTYTFQICLNIKKMEGIKKKEYQNMSRIIYWTSLNNISHSAIYYKTILNEQRETEEYSFKVVPLASNTFCVMFDDFYRNWNQNTIVMAQREKQS